MTRWRLVRAAVIACAAAAVAVPAQAAETPGPTAAGPQEVPPVRGADWQQPTASVSAPPQEIAGDLGARERAQVVVLTAGPDGLDVTTSPRRGRDAVVGAVAAAQDDPGVVAVGVDQPVHSLGVVDPLRRRQWGLTAARATSAWPMSQGRGAVVAVIDSGVNGSHPDLVGAMVPGRNTRTDRGDYSSPATDREGHGTHVAGIIAARVNNGRGGAGVAPQAKIMPVKVLDAQGAGFMSDVVEGIVWAADHGADVINMSLGGPDADFSAPAVAYAVNKGVTVVAAAGNEGSSRRMYPAALPGVLSVSASQNNGTVASFSNFGTWVDLAAPGADILSTVPGGYESWSGTSMAAPHVAGVAALVASVAPAANAAQILQATATDLGAPGRDARFGAGLVNATAAVARACPRCVRVAARSTAPGTASVTLPARLAADRRVVLPRHTSQGAVVEAWRSRTPVHCTVVGRRLTTEAPGWCRLRGTGGDGVGEFTVSARVRIRG